MSELEARIREILGKLQMLADGATANLDPDKVVGHGASSRIPTRGSGSLYEYYTEEFQRYADDPAMLAVLLDLAEDDYRDFRFRADARIEVRKSERVENDPTDPGAAERAQAERVIRWYEGKDPLYVAFTETKLGAKVTEAWVKKARRQLGRNPDDGRPRPEFLDLPEEDRHRKVAYLASHMGKKRAAEKLGVDPGTVRKYWPESAEAPEAVAA